MLDQHRFDKPAQLKQGLFFPYEFQHLVICNLKGVFRTRLEDLLPVVQCVVDLRGHLHL